VRDDDVAEAASDQKRALVAVPASIGGGDGDVRLPRGDGVRGHDDESASRLSRIWFEQGATGRVTAT